MAKAKVVTTSATPTTEEAEMAALLAASGGNSGDAVQDAPDTIESLTAANDAWDEYATGLAKELELKTQEAEGLKDQLAAMQAKVDAYEAQHGTPNEQNRHLVAAATTVFTAAVAMAGHLPQDVSLIPTVDQMNAAGQR